MHPNQVANNRNYRLRQRQRIATLQAQVGELQKEVFALRSENERLRRELSPPEKTPEQLQEEDLALAKAFQQIDRILAACEVPRSVFVPGRGFQR
jgi:regulator of replication initiation timing